MSNPQTDVENLQQDAENAFVGLHGLLLTVQDLYHQKETSEARNALDALILEAQLLRGTMLDQLIAEARADVVGNAPSQEG